MDLGDGLKKVFLAGIGAMAATADATKDLVDSLVKKGELTVEEGRAFHEELKKNAKEKVKEHVSINITKEYIDLSGNLDKLSKEEREHLKEKLMEMEREEALKKEEENKEEESKEKKKCYT